MLAALAMAVWFAWDPVVPYFATAFMLVLGLAVASKNAPPHANSLDSPILCGHVFIAMPMVGFATEHLWMPKPSAATQ
jgi:predicted small integral membrane protein